MPKPKKIVFITKPSDQEPWPEGVPTPEQIAADFPDDQDDKPQAFEQSYYRPIEIPKEFDNDPLLSDTYPQCIARR